MPHYTDYKCACGHSDDIVTEKYPDKMVTCGSCGERIFRTPRVRCADKKPEKVTLSTTGNWPMHSDALGCVQGQQKESYEASVRAGVPTEYDKLGRAVLTSPSHRKRCCEMDNAYDQDAGYSDATPNHKTSRGKPSWLKNRK